MWVVERPSREWLEPSHRGCDTLIVNSFLAYPVLDSLIVDLLTG